MIGELIVSFCERSASGIPKAVEIWAFPDGTLNLLIAKDIPGREREHSFPCTLSQLQATVDGRPIEMEHEGAKVRIDRTGGLVCAQFSGFGDQWKQCIPVDTFQDMLDQSVMMSRVMLF